MQGKSKLALVLALLLSNSATAQIVTSPRLTNVLFSQTQSVTVGNTASELTLLGSGQGSLVVPSGRFVPGQVIYIRAMGFHSAAANPTIDIKVKMNNIVVLDTAVVASGNSTNTMWEMRGMLTVYASGASGQIWGQGYYNETGGGANLFGMVNTSVQSLDLSKDQTFSLTAQWGTQAVSNTITMTNFLLEAGG